MPTMTPKSTLSVPWRHSILTRTIVQSLLLTAGSVIAAAVLAYVIARAHIQQRSLSQVTALAAAKEELIEEVLRSDRERASLLTSREEVQRMFRGGNSWPLEQLLTTLRQEGVTVTGIGIVDTAGEIRTQIGTPFTLAPYQGTPATTLTPVVDKTGWHVHDVRSLIRSPSGTPLGELTVRYDATLLKSQLLSAPTLGTTSEVILARINKGTLDLLHYGTNGAERPVLSLGLIEDRHSFAEPSALAVVGDEGVAVVEDYRGIDTLAAFRFLPSLNWGLVVKLDQADALSGLASLGVLLALLGGVLLCGTMLVAIVAARRLTLPLRQLTNKVERLRPGHWRYRTSVRTKDEVEKLDKVTADLTKRLSNTLGAMEDEIVERTKELAQQYAKDRAILESIEQGVVMIDRSGHVVDINPSALSMMEQKQDKVVGKSVDSVFCLSDRRGKLTGARSPIASVLSKRKSYRSGPDAHLNLCIDEASLMPIMLLVTPMMDGKRCTGAIVVFWDMTEERRVDYIKSEFLSLASHQLRTPLSTINWYIELFSTEESGELSDLQRESLVEMSKATTRMNDLVEALLHTVRLEGGKIEPQLTSTDVKEYFGGLGDELRDLAKQNGIACSVSVPASKKIVETDPILLRVVFQNLFSNAVRYSAKGSEVRFRAKVTGRSLEVSIADEGIGIPKKEQKRIFERLFRAPNAVTKNTDGNGLGLYISKLVVQILGGDISFHSAENKGTTFTVKIPLGKKTTTKKKR